jgi:GntR family transcriptional regulator, transcriptional repressor for pyruvate dehydrogenase complex
MKKGKPPSPPRVARAAQPRLRKRGDLMVEEIKRWMAQQQVKLGDRLPKEAELQALFGLSKGSTREALKSLEVQGLVTLKSGPDGGATVTQVPFLRTFQFVQNHLFFQGVDTATIYGVRRLLEPELAASVAAQVDDETLQRLEANLELCAPLPTSPEQSSRQQAADLYFHDIIAEAAPNALLQFNCRCINEMLRLMVVFKAGAAALRKHGQELHHANLTAHQAILAAMRKRDPERVRKLMLAHIIEVEQLVARMQGIWERRLVMDSELEPAIPFPGVRRSPDGALDAQRKRKPS